MVGIVTGAGLGVENSSGWVLGSRGQLGVATFGRFGENVYVNAATGNLAIDRTDEILIGQGPDNVIGRNYNSFGPATGSTDDNNDNWRLSAQRQVVNLVGTYGAAGSTITRIDWDGSDTIYTWDSASSAYVGKQGAGAYDTLTLASNVWTWTDGDTQTKETYDNLNNGRITTSTDTDGNALTFGYTGSLLTSITATDSTSGRSEVTTIVHTGNNITSITTQYFASQAAYNSNTPSSLTLVTYTYDGQNRLSTVTTDLTPTNTGDNSTVTTTYTYSGTSNRVASIAQTGGALLSIGYDGSNRVQTLTLTNASGDTSTTTFAYYSGYTTVTDANSQVTTLHFDTNAQLTQLDLPPAQSGGTAQHLYYTYNTNGDVLTATDGSGNVTTYTYDSKGNVLQTQDQAGNTVSYTYGSKNELLTATQNLTASSTGNRAPIAYNENLVVTSIGDSVTFDPRLDAIDPDNDALSITAVSTPSHGTATVNSGTSVTYTRTGAGADSFTYTISDGHGHTATATVTVADTPGAADLAPRAVDDNYTLATIGTVIIDPRGNDSDPDRDALTITSVSTPMHGTATVINGGTAIQYTHTELDDDSFTYTISDGHGHTATGTISFTAGTTNQAPVTNSDHIYMQAGNYLTFDPLANDYDPDGDPLTITSVTLNTTGGIPLIQSGGQSVTLALPTSKYGELDVTVSDGHNHAVTDVIHVSTGSSPQSVAPVAHDDSITVEGNNAFTFDPRANDGDLNVDPLTITAVSSPSYGTATIVGGTQIQYTRSSSGTDSFTYTITDGQGYYATATVTVSDPSLTNVAPAAVNDTVVVNGVGDSATFDPRVNDMDADSDALSITAASTPAHGTATIIGNTIKYTRTSAGADSFTYTISDGNGHTATGTVNVAGSVSAGGTPPAQVLTARYAYNSHNHLRFVVSAAGEVTEYTYNSAGQQTSSIIYRGNVYNLTGLGPTDTLSESTLASWVSGLSDKSTVERVDTAYDFRGNISTVTTYSAANTSGAGLTTQPYTVVTYVYDQYGNLLSRQTSGISRSEVFTYDGLGRLLTSTDLNNATTTIAYNDSANTTTVTLANGLVKTSTFNLAGELISYQQSGSGVPTTTTTYKYDKLGQLRMVTDPLGNKTYYLYDNVGRKIASIAADGSMVEYAYDAGDRLTTTISYLNKLTTTQLNSLVDVNGNPANVTLASVRPTTNAADIWTWRIYDTANRLIETIDGDGDAVVYAYDGASNLVSTIAYANALSSGTVSGFKTMVPTTLQIPTLDASRDEVTRNFYDADNRLVAVLNGAGYLSQVVYNPAGEKTETIVFANQVDASLRAGGTLAQLLTNVGTSSNDRHTRNFYDDRGLLRYTLDPTLVPVEYDYDNMGNLTGTIAYAGSINSTSTYTLSYVQSQITSTGLSTNANNRNTWAIYDTASNLLDFAIDANGGVTQYAYDSMGREVKQIAYATTRSTTSLPSLSTMNSWAATHASDAGNRISRMVYDQAGELVYTVDPLGYVTEYRYDGDGRVYLQIRYPGQYTVTDSVTQASLAAQIGSIPADAEQTSYTYTVDGQLASETVGYTSAEAATTSFTYDGRGNRVTTTDPNGNVSYAFYDAAGRATLQIDANGYATATSYTATGAVASVTHYVTAITGTINPASPPTPTTDANDATTTFAYDRLDRVVKVTDAEGYYEQYILDAVGDRVAVQNKLGGVTTNVFDNRGLLTSETLPMVSTNPDGTVEATNVTNTFQYDSFGNRTQMVEASGLSEQRTTTYVYDKLDRLTETDHDTVSTIADDLQTTSNVTPAEFVVYDAFGNVVETTDAAGAHTFFYYDGLGRKIAEVNGAGTLSAFTYDANGNLLTQKVYGDAVSLPGSPGGNPPSPVDPSNYRLTTYTYDHLNRLSTTTVASVLTGQYSGSYSTTTANITLTNYYDSNGNVICQTDGNGNHVWFYYDKNNHKIAQVDQELYLTTYTLDSNGNVLTEKRYATKLGSAPGVPPTSTPPTGTNDATNDRVTNFTYDRNGNRLTESRLNVAAWVVNTSTGALTAASTTATVTYTYNGLGEVTRKTEATGDYTAYLYDTAGRQISVLGTPYTDYQSHTVQQITNEYYDGLNNLTRSVQKGDSYGENVDRVTAYTYGAGGRLASTTDASGFTQNYAYDAAGHVKKMSYSRLKSDGTTSVTEAQAMRYDVLGRTIYQSVASFDGTNWNFGDYQQMQYNTYGEVAAKGVNGLWQETNSYDSSGRIQRSTAGDGVVKFYLYDANGKQTLQITSDGNALPVGYSWSTITLAQAINLLTNNGASAIGSIAVAGMVVTITAYDKRGQATSTIAPLRQISQVYTPSTNTFGAYTTATITRSQTYNAFGEVASQTDARGNVTSYAYNTEGKLITTTHPAVSYTDESGTAHSSVTPIERTYYDLSGRLVGTRDAEQDDGSYDATGLINTRTLLAGSGYGGADPLELAEFHADTGKVTNAYDVFGQLRLTTDALNSVEAMTYDAMGRIKTDTHPTLLGMGYVENYVYDGLGQRTQHWNSLLGSSIVETTDYDMQGRVTQMTDLGGDQTTYSYAWSSTLATTGLGTFGGWTKTITAPAMINSTTHYSSTDSTDYFGREVGKTDLGSHSYGYTFDLAGRLLTQTLGSTTSTYAYYNTGLTSSLQIASGGVTKTGAYQYDVAGNRTKEVYAIGGLTYENETVTWDAMNRMATLSDPGAGGTAAYASVSMSWAYDRDSNIRNMNSSYQLLDAQGNVSGSSSENYWYKYDSMNRFVVTKGTLSGGVISAGSTGQTITYDLAGNRATSTDSSSGTTTYTYVPRTGMISTVKIANVKRATYTYDFMGRLTDYKEFATDGTTVKYERKSTYNNKSELTQDIITEVRTDGTWVSTTGYIYTDASGVYKGGVVVSQTTYTTKNGTSQPTSSMANTFYWWNGAVTNVATYTPDTSQPATTQTSTYTYDTLGNLTSVYIADGRPRTVSFVNTLDGKVLQRDEADNNNNTGDPRELHYYFNGIGVGDVSNNGTSDVDYAASIAEHLVIPGTGPFRDGSSSSTSYADFDQSYDPINGLNYQSTATRYTVQAGDTLESIAYALWGDASYWYLIADANGLTGSETLVAGQDLIIPDKIHNVHNNSDTYRVYDPNEAMGNTSPTAPKKPKHHGGGCGLAQIFIAVIAVAVAVFTAGAALAALGVVDSIGAGITAMATGSLFSTLGGALATVAAGAIGGAVGSIVSQGAAMAMGLQSQFNWGGVAMGAIGGAISAGIGGSGVFSGISDSLVAGGASQFVGDFAQGAVSGMAGSILTQGVGVATGLQKRFDWAGVAAAGIGGGVMSAVGGQLKGQDLGLGSSDANADAIDVITGAAGLIANAGTRTLINGTDFGDNIMAALPDTIGQVIGNMIQRDVIEEQISDALADADIGSASSAAGSGGTVPTNAEQLLRSALPDALQRITKVISDSSVDQGLRDNLSKIYAILMSDKAKINIGIISSGSDVDNIAAGDEITQNGFATININSASAGLFNSDGTVSIGAFASLLVHEGDHAYENNNNGWSNGPENIDQERSLERDAYGVEAQFASAIHIQLSRLGVNGATINLTAATVNDFAESSVKDWADSRQAAVLDAIKEGTKKNAEIDAHNKALDDWNRLHPDQPRLDYNDTHYNVDIPIPPGYTPPH